MRVLFVSSEFPPGPGGIGTQAYQLARHLTQIGWETVVVTPQDYASDEEIGIFNQRQSFQIIRLRLVRKGLIKVLYRLGMIYCSIRMHRPELLFATGDRAVLLTVGLAKYYRLPWIAIEHGCIPVTAWERGLKRWSFQQASAVVCVSQYAQQRLFSQGIQPQRIKVIPNGADHIQFKILPSQAVKDFQASRGLEGAYLLLTVGNVTERKGQDTVIRALPFVLKEMPNTHYLMVGLPTQKDDFMRIALQLNVADQVHFIGVTDADTLVYYLNCCDVFVMTSRHIVSEFEGYGIAVVEAALCGKPCVVSGNSGLTEAIIDGETGLVVPEDDETQTARAILSLLRDKQRRQRMGEAGRERALREQTWEQRAREYDTLLRSLLYKRDRFTLL